MNLDQLTQLFKWMTIINIGLFMLSTLLIISLKGFISQLHSKMFGLGEEQISAILYGYLGIYKIAILIFIVVPYISLLVIN